MKLGAYGALRVAMTLFPLGLAYWRNYIALLAVIGIVYGAMVALVQKDFKFVIGYSSVSHMGFVLLGLMTITTIGLSGAVLQCSRTASSPDSSSPSSAAWFMTAPTPATSRCSRP